MIKRVFLIVIDSFGIGNAPDADRFGDSGSNTLESISHSKEFHIDSLKKLGLLNIDGVTAGEKQARPIGAYGRLSEKSMGKDTTIGHWEIAGVVSPVPLPTYPHGFPPEIMDEFERQTGRGTLCNRPYSGTKVILDYGREHIKTGKLIVYTSADSVFQIAAHEDVVPPEELYKYCRVARDILRGEHGVGRVIARPFAGSYPDFKRTSNRHDFSLLPPGLTMLDVLSQNELATHSVGKIYDIFAGKGIDEKNYTVSNADGMKKTDRYQAEDFTGLCFVNLVDFDMLWGHRNDVDGYAGGISELDRWLGGFIKRMRRDDVLMLCADHGCDPATQSTDHSRECVPLLIYGDHIKPVNLGTRSGFSDIAKTVCDMFGLEGNIRGNSFYKEIAR